MDVVEEVEDRVEVTLDVAEAVLLAKAEAEVVFVCWAVCVNTEVCDWLGVAEFVLVMVREGVLLEVCEALDVELLLSIKLGEALGLGVSVGKPTELV